MAAGILAYGDVNAQHISVNVAQTVSQQRNPVTSFWTVEAPIHTFVGRKQLLEIAHTKLQDFLCQKHFMKRILALVAMGGMGKSETARKLAHKYREFYENVAWIDAETKSGAESSFRKIAKILNLSPSASTGGKELAELVYRHISDCVKKPSLFIFDNAIQLKTIGDTFGIFDWLPRQMTDNLPVILLTSQSTEWRKQGCEAVDVTELSKIESLHFLSTRCKVSQQQVDEDNSLRDLLHNLAERLNGYPLALGLAAANVSYIPDQDSVELLKKCLKKYIQCVDDNTILEQRVDTQLATNYPHTLLKVWDIAMRNLERREHAREAKQLLYILAYFSQYELKHYLVEIAYNMRSEIFGVSFPEETDATFAEALSELQTVGLTTIEKTNWLDKIKLHRLVQTLARLGNAAYFGIQKLILLQIEMGASDHGLVFPQEYLLAWEVIPHWALEQETKLLLWLHGLRFMPNGSGTLAKVVGSKTPWQNQLAKFENGRDIATVAAFVLENPFATHRSSATGSNSDLLWTLIGDANKVKSSLVGPSHDIRVFLEQLLLTIVGEAAQTICDNFYDRDSPEMDLICPDADILDEFREWLNTFDFETAIIDFPDLQEQIDVLVSRFINVSISSDFRKLSRFRYPIYYYFTIIYTTLPPQECPNPETFLPLCLFDYCKNKAKWALDSRSHMEKHW